MGTTVMMANPSLGVCSLDPQAPLWLFIVVGGRASQAWAPKRTGQNYCLGVQLHRATQLLVLWTHRVSDTASPRELGVGAGAGSHRPWRTLRSKGRLGLRSFPLDLSSGGTPASRVTRGAWYTFMLIQCPAHLQAAKVLG